MIVELGTQNTDSRIHVLGSAEASNKKLRALLGGKGFGIEVIRGLGLPVAPSFTIDTSVCNAFLSHPDGGLDPKLTSSVHQALKSIEKAAGKKFGDPTDPLLVSVRSGGEFSMPGMMDTVLDLGINDQIAEGLAALKGERFAFDAYRRFLEGYGKIVLGIGTDPNTGEKVNDPFSESFDMVKKDHGITDDNFLGAHELFSIVDIYKGIIENSGHTIPQDPAIQLENTIQAVFKSWNSPRAVAYREANGIDHNLGTAVNVQEMKFGNRGENSGTGVLFTRDPNTGENILYGDILFNAQGEDVVAGIRNTQKISDLESKMPEVYRELHEAAKKLETEFGEAQDIEFTIEDGKLWIFQTRKAKTTAQAAVRIAHSLRTESIISKEQAVSQIDSQQIEQLFNPTFDPEAIKEAKENNRFLTIGIPASPGAATGIVVFDKETAIKLAKQGLKVIMVRKETLADDFVGMVVSEGIITDTGGRTSHAAVVTRGQGIPCIVGVGNIIFDNDSRTIHINGVEIKEGDQISFDGTTGEIYLGKLATIIPDTEQSELMEILELADEIANLNVWANADKPEDAKKARELGAKGIGLCRTEHMFEGEDRMNYIRQVLMLDQNNPEFKSALNKLLEMQRSDFEGILLAMDGLPVVIRLLDAPLHEFLPKQNDLMSEIAKNREQKMQKRDEKGRFLNLDRDRLVAIDDEIRQIQETLSAVERYTETNPMLGLRGIRFGGVVKPEIYDMQIRAILEAASRIKKQDKSKNPRPKIMIPLVSLIGEVELLQKRTREIADQIEAETGERVNYQFGTMIETPRAVEIIDEIAAIVDFISFGSNDLTQLTFGFSRDDTANSVIPAYVSQNLIKADMFGTLDDKVAEIIRRTSEKARQVNPNIEIGICGEHGGDPKSIAQIHNSLDYASSSPPRVPIARVSAAQAVLKQAA